MTNEGSKFQVGDRVTCNGYPGTISEVCTGQLKGMVVVRLGRGKVCVDASELRKGNK